jgi:hypothetical protein
MYSTSILIILVSSHMAGGSRLRSLQFVIFSSGSVTARASFVNQNAISILESREFRNLHTVLLHTPILSMPPSMSYIKTSEYTLYEACLSRVLLRPLYHESLILLQLLSHGNHERQSVGYSGMLSRSRSCSSHAGISVSGAGESMEAPMDSTDLQPRLEKCWVVL